MPAPPDEWSSRCCLPQPPPVDLHPPPLEQGPGNYRARLEKLLLRLKIWTVLLIHDFI